MFLLQHCYKRWGPVLLGVAEHCLPIGSAQWIPCVAFIACADLTSSTKLSVLQSMSFLTLALPMSKWLVGCQPIIYILLNHNNGPIQLQKKKEKRNTSGFYKCVWRSYLHYSSSYSWFLQSCVFLTSYQITFLNVLIFRWYFMSFNIYEWLLENIKLAACKKFKVILEKHEL